MGWKYIVIFISVIYIVLVYYNKINNAKGVSRSKFVDLVSSIIFLLLILFIFLQYYSLSH